MINFRNIFNPSYNYIGIICIIIIALLIIIVQRDTLASIYQISKTSFIAGIVTLIIALISSFLTNLLIPNSYKIFIEIISDNVLNHLYFYSILIIIISSILMLIIKTITKQKDPLKQKNPL